MPLTAEQVSFMHAVADRLDSEVLPHASGGQWAPGTGRAADRWSTLRAIDDGEEFHVGTAIDKRDQRVMVCGQPLIAATLSLAVRAVSADTPSDVAEPLLVWCEQVNIAAGLKVPQPAAAV